MSARNLIIARVTFVLVCLSMRSMLNFHGMCKYCAYHSFITHLSLHIFRWIRSKLFLLPKSCTCIHLLHCAFIRNPVFHVRGVSWSYGVFIMTIKSQLTAFCKSMPTESEGSSNNGAKHNLSLQRCTWTKIKFSLEMSISIPSITGPMQTLFRELKSL